VESRTAERNRLLKLLETANIKLASVATDVFGVSGLLMMHALVEGKATAQETKKATAQEDPRTGAGVEEHHRFLLRVQLQPIPSRLDSSGGTANRRTTHRAITSVITSMMGASIN
jgi:hypothetical protein